MTDKGPSKPRGPLSAIDRRRLLMLTGQGLTAAMTLALLPGDDLAAATNLGDTPFKLGVASGDPEPDSIVIWTRLAPDPLAEDGSGGMPAGNAPVRWQVATDEGMRHVVVEGTAMASARLGHSVHVEIYGLRPGRRYFYRFTYRGEESPVGHTLTAPARGARVDNLNFAYASCQDWPSGFYNAYRFMAREDIDLVFHLGDYIYEYGIPADGGNRRVSVPPALQIHSITLSQFVCGTRSTRPTPICRRRIGAFRSSASGTTTRSRTTTAGLSSRAARRRSRAARRHTKPITSTCRSAPSPCRPGRTCASIAA